MIKVKKAQRYYLITEEYICIDGTSVYFAPFNRFKLTVQLKTLLNAKVKGRFDKNLHYIDEISNTWNSIIKDLLHKDCTKNTTGTLLIKTDSFGRLKIQEQEQKIIVDAVLGLPPHEFTYFDFITYKDMQILYFWDEDQNPLWLSMPLVE